MSDVDLARATLLRWREDPICFVRECLDLEPDPYQAEFLAAFRSRSQLALVGSKGVGKTATEAMVILNFLLTRPHANIAVTSISADNLRDGLWKELARLIGRSPVLSQAFVWQAQRIVSKESPATWWVSARQWSKSADTQQQSEVLAGLHADYTMFCIDEAGSVPMAVAVTAQAALSTGIECKFVLGGNPTSLDGPLYAAAVTHRSAWHVTTATGDPDDPQRASRVDLTWAREMVQQFGPDNPWNLVNVYGRWPPSSIDSLLGVEDVQAAMTRQVRPDAYQWAQKRLGVDVARGGGDRTVIFPRQGLVSFQPIVLRLARDSAISVTIANHVMASKLRWGSELEMFDATGGWAAGAVDVLRAAGHGPINVQFAAPAIDSRYYNRRAEIWFLMAEWVKGGGVLPNVPDLVGELTTPTYTFRRGKFLMEEKDMVKARLGRSPDCADALALTFGMPEMPQRLMGRARQTSAVHEFDPFVHPDDASRPQ